MHRPRAPTSPAHPPTTQVGAEVDSYYEYLLKYWVLGGKADNHWRDRWVNATDQILDTLLYYPAHQPFAYTGEQHGVGASIDGQLEHLACFWPGEAPQHCLNIC